MGAWGDAATQTIKVSQSDESTKKRKTPDLWCAKGTEQEKHADANTVVKEHKQPQTSRRRLRRATLSIRNSTIVKAKTTQQIQKESQEEAEGIRDLLNQAKHLIPSVDQVQEPPFSESVKSQLSLLTKRFKEYKIPGRMMDVDVYDIFHCKFYSIRIANLSRNNSKKSFKRMMAPTQSPQWKRSFPSQNSSGSVALPSDCYSVPTVSRVCKSLKRELGFICRPQQSPLDTAIDFLESLDTVAACLRFLEAEPANDLCRTHLGANDRHALTCLLQAGQFVIQNFPYGVKNFPANLDRAVEFVSAAPENQLFALDTKLNHTLYNSGDDSAGLDQIDLGSPKVVRQGGESVSDLSCGQHVSLATIGQQDKKHLLSELSRYQATIANDEAQLSRVQDELATSAGMIEYMEDYIDASHFLLARVGSEIAQLRRKNQSCPGH